MFETASHISDACSLQADQHVCSLDQHTAGREVRWLHQNSKVLFCFSNTAFGKEYLKTNKAITHRCGRQSLDFSCLGGLRQHRAQRSDGKHQYVSILQSAAGVLYSASVILTPGGAVAHTLREALLKVQWYDLQGFLYFIVNTGYNNSLAKDRATLLPLCVRQCL